MSEDDRPDLGYGSEGEPPRDDDSALLRDERRALVDAGWTPEMLPFYNPARVEEELVRGLLLALSNMRATEQAGSTRGKRRAARRAGWAVEKALRDLKVEPEAIVLGSPTADFAGALDPIQLAYWVKERRAEVALGSRSRFWRRTRLFHGALRRLDERLDDVWPEHSAALLADGVMRRPDPALARARVGLLTDPSRVREGDAPASAPGRAASALAPPASAVRPEDVPSSSGDRKREREGESERREVEGKGRTARTARPRDEGAEAAPAYAREDASHAASGSVPDVETGPGLDSLSTDDGWAS